MESLKLIIYLVFFIILYLLICDCFLKKKEQFYNSQGLRLLHNKNQDIQTGGYFGKIPTHQEVKGEHGTYVPLYAISNREKKKLFSIVEPIIKKINHQVKLKFKLVDVESFYQQVEETGNVRLKLDIFMFETLNHYQRRLLLDITLDYSVNKIIVNHIILTNAKVLTPPDPLKNRDIYFSERILTEDNKLASSPHQDAIYGVGDSKLAFNKVDFEVQKYGLLDTNFTEWVFPQEYLQKINDSLPVWPCRSEDFNWDTNSINRTQIGSDMCQGINTSYQERNYIPKFNPGMRQVSKDDDYNWIHHMYTRNFSSGMTKSS